MDITVKLQAAAEIMRANRIPPPYRASLVHNGIGFWIWIDENGEACPPPSTVEQPTAAA